MQAKKVTLTLPVPRVDLEKTVTQLVEEIVITGDKLKLYFFSVIRKVLGNIKKSVGKGSGGVIQQRPLNKFQESRKSKLSPKVLRIAKIILLIVVSLAIIVGLGKIFDSVTSNRSSGRVSLKSAKATQSINREFLFPLRGGDGKSLSDIKFLIEKAEVRDEIVVKGKRATSIKGRTFLIITIKITNQYSQAIKMNTKDYLRLSVNKNEEEWLAPDIHNDPVEIQAISTKYARIGFPINDTDKDLVLRVGEINGPKEKIDLDLK